MVELKILKGKSEGVSVYLARKNITLSSKGGMPTLLITNEYGNSIKYEISDNNRFDNLIAILWQFVKDSEH